MARYYCEYCHSYLTHDTLSVRKSHLVGKNHLRIAADYYRNQAHNETKRKISTRLQTNRKCKKQNLKEKDHSTVKIHCSTKKEKRNQRRIYAAHIKELKDSSNSSTILAKDLASIYYGSPGYSKVWIDSNRFDVGELVKATGLPRRANIEQQTHRGTEPILPRDHVFTRNETKTSEGSSFVLAPPMILSQWNNTLPKQTMYNDSGNIMKTTLQTGKRRFQEHTTSDYQYKRPRV
ncbi:similar to Saccharomyces cerevisiae YLR298C YHC1 Component of the U1 snRNP complex required for pre-mRNA splicing [Maudiozyma barnettii]|uniref:Similar to Saccharomyces cerevisiae YLR298C YHC1 Component of the U1 snRNP complex required for pre-mRNA splicing n=1 Tax=Maudiozyma barnettii TaxID=61262 RepID=A0A8H2ZIF2_9SACH|nr:Yhc1p [Kazachstania barnettii]CAB4255848.1 similar to Saccharomyces cerevisiae YLR298C YHC1 Component of the U1 snRNP complex required for pre-mRNA splicing [Kazachstania barnettii]CAD1784408.1 similar to Saccharomyces cerevisiae YLR298C YHC1 Component of the U1 snRNP complex required for pre-mRNA splicing [Kazachstania barnettii]